MTTSLDDLRKEYFNPPKEDTHMEPGTPGPWEVAPFEGYPLEIQKHWGDGTHYDVVCSIGGEWAIEDDAECQANARLIAAAPALRDALQACVESQECNGYIGAQSLSEARAALALIDPS